MKMAIVPCSQSFTWIDIVLAVVAVVAVVSSVYMWNELGKLKRYSKLSTILASAGSHPVGVVVDRAGKQIPFVCEQDPKNKGLLSHDNYTLVNPDLVKPSARTKLYGSEMLYYPLPHFFPFGFTESAALVQTAKKIRENEKLSWIPSELTVLCLLFNGTQTLYDDCRTVIENSMRFGDEIPDIFLTEPIDDEIGDEYDDVDEFEEGEDDEVEIEE